MARSASKAANKAALPRGRVLIYNFFAGVLERGIPNYAENLCIAFEKSGMHCVQIKCPKLIRRLPRPILNLVFVFAEQFLVPILALGFDLTICPYNSAPIASAALKRISVVVHDFIPNAKRNRSLAARYIQFSQWIHALFGRDVIYVSTSSRRIGSLTRRFWRSRSFLFPNAFFQFENLAPAKPMVNRRDHVLLCSGWGKNKDLAGAIDLYFQSDLYRHHELRILGLGDHGDLVAELCKKYVGIQDQILVLQKINTQEVVNEYRSAAWVWVHSQKEGYGRSIAEAKLCGAHIVASDIAPFREQKDDMTYLYSDLKSFITAVDCCESEERMVRVRPPVEHELLHAEVERFLYAHGILDRTRGSHIAIHGGPSREHEV